MTARMRVFTAACHYLLVSSLTTISFAMPSASTATYGYDGHHESIISPKVVLINMFASEGEVWYQRPEFNLLEKNITVPGLSPLFPDVHCTANHDVCQVITGEAESNAATTITALTFSPLFNLKLTYFLIAGIAGINPKVATLGSVTFARYAVQVALEYEIDAREIPANFSTGYFPQGSSSPTQYPQEIYGTEVFELNQALQELSIAAAQRAQLNDSLTAQAYRANYATTQTYKPGSSAPGIVACDVATADVFFTGLLLSEAIENTTRLFTNGSGVYCTTAQEDNATLEALLRGAIHHLVDFSRIILMRSASDFDRPYAGQAALTNLLSAQGGFEPAIENLYLAGVQVIGDILTGWRETFAAGIKARNYVGDIFGSLLMGGGGGGLRPDFGPSGNIFGDNPVPTRMRMRMRKRRVYNIR